MFEELVIGFLLGILSQLNIWPGKQSFWQWAYHGIRGWLKKE